MSSSEDPSCQSIEVLPFNGCCKLFLVCFQYNRAEKAISKILPFNRCYKKFLVWFQYYGAEEVILKVKAFNRFYK